MIGRITGAGVLHGVDLARLARGAEAVVHSRLRHRERGGSRRALRADLVAGVGARITRDEGNLKSAEKSRKKSHKIGHLFSDSEYRGACSNPRERPLKTTRVLRCIPAGVRYPRSK